jgi:selenide,water dikinase
VLRLTDELALIQTLDFFTPIVDDPFVFGQIAAANALSDVYAMGGRPISAMNIVAFPVATLPIEVLHDVLRGGLDKLREAGVPLVGGHSIDDAELKYGLSVSGLVHPERIWTNRGARPGDRLVLTKPVGTGVVSTALKRGRADDRAVERIVGSMKTLNREAAMLLGERGMEVHACTDVTGFGLVGHAREMIQDSDLGLTLYAEQVELFDGALGFARDGLVPGGLGRNREHYLPWVDVHGDVEPALIDLLHDPQTSGGLLVALPGEAAQGLVQTFGERGISARVVGAVAAAAPGRIRIEAGS